MKKHYKWTLDQDYCFWAPFDFGVQREYHDHQGRVWLTIDGNFCIIHKGYSWDGCSPKIKTDLGIIGTWDGFVKNHWFQSCGKQFSEQDQQLKYASLEHDAFCQFFNDLPNTVTQEEIDYDFYLNCKAVGFKLSWLYYIGVRTWMKYYRKRA